MNGFLKVLPMLLTFSVTYILLMKIDKKYFLITKIDSKLKIEKSYKPLFYFFSMIMSTFIFAFIDLPEPFSYILSGLIVGVALSFIAIAEKN